MHPTVVFVEDVRWTGFSQLSSALRKSGYHTVLITIQLDRFVAALSKLGYHDVVTVNSIRDISSLGSRIDWSTVRDIQCSERLLSAVLDAISPLEICAPLTEHLKWRLRSADKLNTSRHLAEHEILVPATVSGDAMSPREAIEKLGLPVLVKPRIGAGGHAVTVARSLEDASEAISCFQRASEYYFECYVAGQMVRYAACQVAGTAIQEATYVGYRLDSSALGPATSIQLTHSPELVQISRAAMAALNGIGLANIEYIRDAEGQYWLIDVNFRAWGTVVALRAFGLDFVRAYRNHLGEHNKLPGLRSDKVGKITKLFPDAVQPALARGPYLQGALRFLQLLARYVTWLGPRFGVLGCLEFLSATHSRLKGLAERPSARGRPHLELADIRSFRARRPGSDVAPRENQEQVAAR